MEDGTIELLNRAEATGYRQGAAELRTWRGSYRVLMDADDNIDGSATNNRLILDGDFDSDFDGRKLSVGRLNLTAEDGIELKGNTSAVLQVSEITAKNIAVPAGASLTLQKDEGRVSAARASLTLAPDPGCAAIGGNRTKKASGQITVSQLAIAMTMPVDSAASGIGAGSQESEAACGDIIVNDCSVVADERSTAASSYGGSWIGGPAVANVTISDSSIQRTEESDCMTGPFVVRGDCLALSSVEIGTQALPVNDPILAKSSLSLTNCTIYQRIESPLGTVAALGAAAATENEAGGSVSIQNSTVVADFTGGGSSDSLYTGQLLLQDAASHVKIKGVQLVDVNNGSVTITPTQLSQEEAVHAHAGSYLLLNAFDGYTGQSSLVVTGLSGGALLQTQAMTLQTMTVAGDAFTFVVMDDAAVINGTLVQDHFRLSYELPDANYSSANLPKVLRSETSEGSEGHVTYLPSIPATKDIPGITTYCRQLRQLFGPISSVSWAIQHLHDCPLKMTAM